MIAKEKQSHIKEQYENEEPAVDNYQTHWCALGQNQIFSTAANMLGILPGCRPGTIPLL